MSEPTPASLHVADLNPTVTEPDLFESFGQYGAVSIRVCRDDKTRESLGYAYVNFDSKENARRALEMLNHKEIDGRPCKIDLLGWDSDQYARLLCVKNLDKRVDSRKLHEVFGSCGEIIYCTVITDATTGESQGYGYVQFSSLADAKKALQDIDGKNVHVGDEGEKGQPICVRPCVESKRPSKDQYINVCLDHLNTAITAEKFVELVTKATQDVAHVNGARLSQPRIGTIDGRSGYVYFETREIAERAMDRFRDMEKMKELVPELLHPEQALSADLVFLRTRCMVRIENLAEWVTGKQLEGLFAPIGEIYSAEIVVDKDTKQSQGLVCFRHIEHARKAVTQMNNSFLGGRSLQVALVSKEDGIQRSEASSKQQPATSYLHRPQPVQASANSTFTSHPSVAAPPAPTAVSGSHQELDNAQLDYLKTLLRLLRTHVDTFAPVVTSRGISPALATLTQRTYQYLSECEQNLWEIDSYSFNGQLDGLSCHLGKAVPDYSVREIPPAGTEFTQRMMAPYHYGPYHGRAHPMVPGGTRMPRGGPGYLSGRGGFPGMNMAQRGRPQGAFPRPPGVRPVEAVGSIRGRLKNVPDDHKMQFLVDTLFSLVKGEDGTDPYRIVGTLLKTYSGSSLEETVNRLVPLCEDPEKRAEAIQKLQLPSSQ